MKAGKKGRQVIFQYSACLPLASPQHSVPLALKYLTWLFQPGNNYSEAKATQIDEEATRFVEEAHDRVPKILSERRTVLDGLAHLLSQKESVQGDELRTMLSVAAKAA